MNSLEKYQSIFDLAPQVETAVRGGKTCQQISRVMGFSTDTMVRRYLREQRPDLLEIAVANGKRAQQNPHRNPDPSQLTEAEKATAQAMTRQLDHQLGSARAMKLVGVSPSQWSRWRNGAGSPTRPNFDALQSAYGQATRGPKTGT